VSATHPPLSEHQVRTLALLLQRAIANQQLALHEQLLDAKGVETEQGANLVATDWIVQADEITFADETPARFGIHLYIAATDLDELCAGGEA
jgi:hypothetical protein